MYPIVINKQSRVPYEYLGDNKFKNLHTQTEGDVPEDKANEVFLINADINLLCDGNENLKKLITNLKLCVEK